MSPSGPEELAVQRLESELSAKGYRVQRDAMLPFSLPGVRPYQVDMLAERDDEHRVIEVALRGVRGAPQSGRWSELAEQVRSRPGWHFQVVLVDQEPTVTLDPQRIAAELANAETLLADGNVSAAVLLAAAAFEAAASLKVQPNGGFYKSAIALLERLVSDGEIGQEEFVPLRDAIQLRDGVAHGQFNVASSAGDAASQLVSAGRRLLTAT
jgi:hypothetical protein